MSTTPDPDRESFPEFREPGVMPPVLPEAVGDLPVPGESTVGESDELEGEAGEDESHL